MWKTKKKAEEIIFAFLFDIINERSVLYCKGTNGHWKSIQRIDCRDAGKIANILNSTLSLYQKSDQFVRLLDDPCPSTNKIVASSVVKTRFESRCWIVLQLVYADFEVSGKTAETEISTIRQFNVFS